MGGGRGGGIVVLLLKWFIVIFGLMEGGCVLGGLFIGFMIFFLV